MFQTFSLGRPFAYSFALAGPVGSPSTFFPLRKACIHFICSLTLAKMLAAWKYQGTLIVLNVLEVIHVDTSKKWGKFTSGFIVFRPVYSKIQPHKLSSQYFLSYYAHAKTFDQLTFTLLRPRHFLSILKSGKVIVFTMTARSTQMRSDKPS